MMSAGIAGKRRGRGRAHEGTRGGRAGRAERAHHWLTSWVLGHSRLHHTTCHGAAHGREGCGLTIWELAVGKRGI